MIPERKTMQSELLVGIDVGSTTTKLVAADKDSKEILYSSYKRHNSSQVQSVQEALGRLREQFPEGTVRVAMTGSGAKPVAEALEVPFIQEVVANSVVLCEKYPNVRTAIELGGEISKCKDGYRAGRSGRQDHLFPEESGRWKFNSFRYADERKLCRRYRGFY